MFFNTYSITLHEGIIEKYTQMFKGRCIKIQDIDNLSQLK